MCKYQNDSVFAMDIGFLSFRVLSIDSPRQFEFRRQTSCSPVVDPKEHGNIQNISNEILRVEYRYGVGSNRWRRWIWLEHRSLNYNDWTDQPSASDIQAPNAYLSKAYSVR